jgi:hypothetical protein
LLFFKRGKCLFKIDVQIMHFHSHFSNFDFANVFQQPNHPSFELFYDLVHVQLSLFFLIFETFLPLLNNILLIVHSLPKRWWSRVSKNSKLISNILFLNLSHCQLTFLLKRIFFNSSNWWSNPLITSP